MCIKQSNGVFHIGFPLINKVMCYTLAMGEYRETREDCARKLVKEPAADPLSSSFHACWLPCFCFDSLFPRSPFAIYIVVLLYVLWRTKPRAWASYLFLSYYSYSLFKCIAHTTLYWCNSFNIVLSFQVLLSFKHIMIY